MKEKYKKRICIAAILCGLLLVGIFISSIYFTKKKIFPSQASYYVPGMLSCHTENGLYFIKNYNYIYYVDRRDGKATPICRKTGCLHNNTDCCAYVEGTLVPGLMYYNDRLYITTQCSNYRYNEQGEIIADEGYCRIYEADKYGDRKRIIFEIGPGGIQSIYAFEDRLYISATENDYITNKGTYMKTNAYLYYYDLRWDEKQIIFSIQEDEEMRNPYVCLIEGDGKQVYFSRAFRGREGNYKCDLFEIRDKEIIKINVNQVENSVYPMFIVDNKKYMIRVINEAEEKYICVLNDNFQETCRLLDMKGKDTHIQRIGDQYLIIAKSKHSKCLYDFKKDILYVAKTCFHFEENCINDIVDIDTERNIIYIDQQDYTGIAENEVYYEDISDYGCDNLSRFLEENYVEYCSLSEKEKKEIEDMVVYYE
jgi:hypothetical protein